VGTGCARLSEARLRPPFCLTRAKRSIEIGPLKTSLFLLAPARRGFFSEKLIDLFPPIPQSPPVPTTMDTTLPR
jgi:hypothetical protein